MISIFRFISLLSGLALNWAHASTTTHAHKGIYRRNVAFDNELENAQSRNLDELDDHFFALEPLPNQISEESEYSSDNILRLDNNYHPDVELLSEPKEIHPSSLKYLNNHLDYFDDESIQFPQDRKRRRISHEHPFDLFSLKSHNHHTNDINHQPIHLEEIRPTFWDDIENSNDETIQFPQDSSMNNLGQPLFSVEPQYQADDINDQWNHRSVAIKPHQLKDPESPYYHSDNQPIEFPGDRKRRRIFPGSKELKKTGINLYDTSDAGHAAEINRKNDKAVQISRHLLDIINQRAGVDYRRLPYLRPDDVINWPPMKQVNPVKLSAVEVTGIYENLKLLDIKEEFIQKLRFKQNLGMKSYTDFARQDLREHVRNLLNQLSKEEILVIPWDIITTESFTWWPSDIKDPNPRRLNKADLKKIIPHIHHIQLTEEFKAKYLKYLDVHDKH